jgi:hypothetical protein
LPFPVARSSAERAPKFPGDRIVSDGMETPGIAIGGSVSRNSLFSNSYEINAEALTTDYVVGRFSRLPISCRYVAVRPLRPAVKT